MSLRPHLASRAATAAAVLALNACRNLAAPDRDDLFRDVVVAAGVPTYSTVPAGNWVAVSIPLTVRNGSRTTIYYDACGTGVERRGPDGWTGVWSQPCLLIAGVNGQLAVAPGAEATATVAFSVTLGAGTAGQWTAPLDGDYRVRAMLSDGVGTLPDPAVHSQSFPLRRP